MVSKFVKTHRVVIVTVSTFVGILIAVVGIIGALAVNATRARNEAQESAKQARLNEQLYLGASVEAQKGRLDAEFRAIGFQVAMDLENLHPKEVMIERPNIDGIPRDELQLDEPNDLRVGLLRLARPLKTEFNPFPLEGGDRLKVVPSSLADRLQPIQELIAATVITLGQKFAPLRPSLSHDPEGEFSYYHSPDGSTFLTWGPEDKKIRLWDARTDSLKGILTENAKMFFEPIEFDYDGSVKHIKPYSPDSKTILTLHETGKIQLWSAENAKFLCGIEGSHAFYETADNKELEAEQIRTGTYQFINRINRSEYIKLGNNRLITKRVKAIRRPNTGGTKIIDQEFAGPVELWDSKTGKLIKRFDMSSKNQDFDFSSNPDWITTFLDKSTFVILSAIDGREIMRFVHPTRGKFTNAIISPGAKRILIQAEKTPTSEACYIWESNPWRLLTRITEIEQVKMENPEFKNDDLLVFSHQGDLAPGMLYDFKDPGKVTIVSHKAVSRFSRDGLFWMEAPDRIADVGTKKRLIPPPGRKYHSALQKFTQDGRFFLDEDKSWIDTVTEMKFKSNLFPCNLICNIDRFGSLYFYAIMDENRRGGGTSLFPAPRFLKVPPDLLQLWIQVAVRGELGASGEFIPWNEEAWQKKQQELGTFPPPHPEFPFPGYLATDKLHWLRAEFHSVPEGKKHPLAKELLRRAESMGNISEARRWRNWLELSAAKKPK